MKTRSEAKKFIPPDNLSAEQAFGRVYAVRLHRAEGA